MTMTVSNSSIQAFKHCRRRWMLTYEQGLAPKEKTLVGPLALGSRVHKALERMYGHQEDPLLAHAVLLDADRENVLENGGDLGALEADGELSRVMLEGYLQWVEDSGLDDGLEVIGVEEHLTLPLYGDRAMLVGKMDLRVRSDDAVSILDFKTAQSFNDYDLVHLFEQGPTYWTLDRANEHVADRIDSFTLRILKKVKRTARATPPFYVQIHQRFNPFSMRSFWLRMHGVVREMLRVHDALKDGEDHRTVAYPSPSRNCSWQCPFVSICHMFDDGSAVQEAIDEQYHVVDPFAYYGSDATKEE